MSTDLAIRKTLPALVAAYKRSEVEIRQAYDLLESAEKRLLAAFVDVGQHHFTANPRDHSKVALAISGEITVDIPIFAAVRFISKIFPYEAL